MPVLFLSHASSVSLSFQFCFSLMLVLFFSHASSVSLSCQFCFSFIPVLFLSHASSVSLSSQFCFSLMLVLFLSHASSVLLSAPSPLDSLVCPLSRGQTSCSQFFPICRTPRRPSSPNWLVRPVCSTLHIQSKPL